MSKAYIRINDLEEGINLEVKGKWSPARLIVAISEAQRAIVRGALNVRRQWMRSRRFIMMTKELVEIIREVAQTIALVAIVVNIRILHNAVFKGLK